tara:strand:- start:151 stop:756 length:606 start_codon:yes stop_codon:yes gene_type:complete
MKKYSHKDILNEGISGLLRKGIAKAAQAAAAAGGAVKAGAQQGPSATAISLAKGAKQGYRDEKRKQRLNKKPEVKKDNFSSNVKKALSNIKDEGSKDDEPEVKKTTFSSFKGDLKEFVLDKMPGTEFMSKKAITEFVRSLAKKEGNTTYTKNLLRKINSVKKDNKVFSNNELIALLNLLKLDGLIKESQIITLRQLTLLTE